MLAAVRFDYVPIEGLIEQEDMGIQRRKGTQPGVRGWRRPEDQAHASAAEGDQLPGKTEHGFMPLVPAHRLPDSQECEAITIGQPGQDLDNPAAYAPAQFLSGLRVHELGS